MSKNLTIAPLTTMQERIKRLRFSDTNPTGLKGFTQRQFKTLAEKSATSTTAKNTLSAVGLLAQGLSGLLGVFSIDIGFNNMIESLHNGFLFKPDHTRKFPKPKGVEDVEIKLNDNENTTLRGYFIEKPDTDLVILYLHGYNASVNEVYPECKLLQKYIDASVLAVDYRGFGKSAGIKQNGEKSEPTINGTITDVKAMLNYLVNEKGYKEEDVIVHGISLGAALGLELAHHLTQENKRVALVSLLHPFSSIPDIAKERHPYLPGFLALKKPFNVKRLAQKIDSRIPVFIAHGKDDKETKPVNSSRIHRRVVGPKPKEPYFIPGVEHEDLSVHPDKVHDYLQTLSDFLHQFRQ